MIDLLSLEKQQISKNLRGKYFLIYGEPKVGKTSFAAQFENVLIVSFEMGSNALNSVYVQPAKTWNDWKMMVNQLCKKQELKEKFHSIAIDTADIAWDACVRFICSREGVEELSEIAWGKGYQMAKDEYQDAFRDLTFAGYGIIFTSHSTEKTYKNDKGEEYNKIIPALPSRPFDIVNKMVDNIIYIRSIKEISPDGNVTSKRYMFFRGDDRFLAGSRYRYIEDKAELSYQNLVDCLYRAIDLQAKEDGTEVTDAESPYANRSFSELLEDAKQIWIKVVGAEKESAALKILEEVFGEPIKFSDIQESQKDLFEKALFLVKELI